MACELAVPDPEYRNTISHLGAVLFLAVARAVDFFVKQSGQIRPSTHDFVVDLDGTREL